MINWTAQQAVALREFLKAAPAFLPTLEVSLPEIMLTSGQETTAATGAAHAGGEKIIKKIKSLAEDGIPDGRSPYIPTGSPE